MFCNDDLDALLYSYALLGGNNIMRIYGMQNQFGQYQNMERSMASTASTAYSMYSHNIFSANELRACCCNTFNTIEAQCQQTNLYPEISALQFDKFYADNAPVESLAQAASHKTTIFDLDRLIFPEDPIRDWVEKKVAEIEDKYAWADKIYV